MGFHRIPSLRLGNQIGSIFCRFTPLKANKIESDFVRFFCVAAAFGRGAPAARVRLPVAFVNAEACGEEWRREDCAGERNVVKYAKGQIIFSALSEIDTVSEYNAA